MNITIKKGTMEYLNDCEEALLNSELGRTYFANEGSGKKAVLEGLEQGTLYVALAEDICVGFFYYIPKGCFHSFPYLHLISVKEKYRSKGIGQKLIDYFENTACANCSKLFLTVADFNLQAKRFYEKNGYQQVGALPSLHRKGITEYIMMKGRD